MTSRKKAERLPPGVRLACPLECSKGFLSISQLNEHIFRKHASRGPKSRETTDAATPTISTSKLVKVRAVIQEKRLRSTRDKIQELSKILNDGEDVALYQLPASIYRQTVKAVVDDPRKAVPFLDALAASIRARHLFEETSKSDIIKALCIIKSFLSVVDQDGICFINGEWVEMKRTGNQRFMSSHGLRFACPLGCDKGFLSISQLNEHIFKKHAPSCSATETTRTIDYEKMSRIRATAQEQRLQRNTADKVEIISLIANGGKDEPVFYVTPSTYRNSARAVAEGPQEGLLAIQALQARLGWQISHDEIVKALTIVELVIQMINESGFFFMNGQWYHISNEVVEREDQSPEPESAITTIAEPVQADWVAMGKISGRPGQEAHESVLGHGDTQTESATTQSELWSSTESTQDTDETRYSEDHVNPSGLSEGELGRDQLPCLGALSTIGFDIQPHAWSRKACESSGTSYAPQTTVEINPSPYFNSSLGMGIWEGDNTGLPGYDQMAVDAGFDASQLEYPSPQN